MRLYESSYGGSLHHMSLHFILTTQVIKLKLMEGRGQFKGNQFFYFLIWNKLYGVRLGSSLWQLMLKLIWWIFMSGIILQC